MKTIKFNGDQESLFRMFMVFNCIPPKKEGVDPTVYFYHSVNDSDSNQKMIQAGLIITFISFCNRFKSDKPCDYILSDKQEISILELFGPIWMAVVIKYNGRNNRELLSAILDYCRMMFSYYFVPLPDSREENLNQMTADPKILVAIPHAFESILATINWNRISLDTYIFNSYQRQPMDGDPSEIQDFCQRVLNLKIEQNGKELNEFDSITILCQKKVVYSSLDPTSVRAVAFGLRRKFTHLFLHNPKTTYQSLTWLIGMYINSEGRHSFFQQPIYYDKKPHSIIAFKYQKYKIFITQPMDIEVSDKYFLSIPRKLARIQQYLKERYPRYIENNIPIPFAIAKNSRKDQIMVLDSFQIDAVLRVLVDANFVLAHQHTLHYDDNFAEIAFPSSSGLFVNSINDNNEETELILMMKVSARNISEYLKICKLIKKRKENVQEKHCSLL